ncbi:MAG: hypothetical protein OXT09_25425, partial [Myxococcales bacterium]|nr:hypothetical protein [Myxococcales bacterium]
GAAFAPAAVFVAAGSAPVLAGFFAADIFAAGFFAAGFFAAGFFATGFFAVAFLAGVAGRLLLAPFLAVAFLVALPPLLLLAPLAFDLEAAFLAAVLPFAFALVARVLLVFVTLELREVLFAGILTSHAAAASAATY